MVTTETIENISTYLQLYQHNIINMFHSDAQNYLQSSWFDDTPVSLKEGSPS